MLDLKLTDYDRKFYEENIKDFLPDVFYDTHSHLWSDEHRINKKRGDMGAATWPSLVALDNSAEDLDETYKTIFPGKKVIPLVCGNIGAGEDFEAHNRFVEEGAKKYGWPALYFSSPKMSADELRENILKGGFLGVKAYLNHSPRYLPNDEIRIYDFFPPHQLEVINELGGIVLCHIARSRRLGDPVNLAQIREIDEKYPNLTLIVAHIGRAYGPNDIGNGFEELAKTKNVYVDFAANCYDRAMVGMLKSVGYKRSLYGSDMPIFRMKARRIIDENGMYINLVPKGYYGDLSGEIHMRELEGKEAEELSFYIYDEILAFKRAAEEVGLTKEQVEDVFYGNAKELIERTRKKIYG